MDDCPSVNIPKCKICGQSPIYTLTAANNHTLRCDGNPIGSDPRHTLYVFHKTREGVEALWSTAMSQELRVKKRPKPVTHSIQYRAVCIFIVVALVSFLYASIAFTVFAFRHPHFTSTQRFLHIIDALMWRSIKEENK